VKKYWFRFWDRALCDIDAYRRKRGGDWELVDAEEVSGMGFHSAWRRKARHVSIEQEEPKHVEIVRRKAS